MYIKFYKVDPTTHGNDHVIISYGEVQDSHFNPPFQ